MPVFRDVHGCLYRIPSAQLQSFAIEAGGSERIEGVQLPSSTNRSAADRPTAQSYIWPDELDPLSAGSADRSTAPSYEWPDGLDPLSAGSADRPTAQSYIWPDELDPLSADSADQPTAQSYIWPDGLDPLFAGHQVTGQKQLGH